MAKSKKKKFNRIICFSLLIAIISSWSFCFSPKEAYAQDAELEENMPDLPDSGVSRGKTENEHHSSDESSVLPCCQNHDRITKIDTVKNRSVDDVILPVVEGVDISFQLFLPQNSLDTKILDSPPPDGERLASIYKKE